MTYRTNFDPTRFRDFLKNKLNQYNANIINEAIIANNAIIAGGSVLQVYSDAKLWKNTDIDIYVNQKNATQLLTQLLPISDFDILNSHMASPYCESFYKKNKIMRRICAKINYDNVDIMIVENSRELTDVVTNFDLTFCEIWYDGNAIYATEKDVRNKHGFLRKEYENALFRDNNSFIKRRIKKYSQRGFKIEVVKSATPILLEFKEKTTPNVINNREEWVVKLVINRLLNIERPRYGKKNGRNTKYDLDDLQFLSSFSRFTISQLKKNIKLYIIKILMDRYNVQLPMTYKAVCVYSMCPVTVHTNSDSDGEFESQYKLYENLNDKYKRIIHEVLRITENDINEIKHSRSVSEYFRSMVETLPVSIPIKKVLKSEYNTFIEKNKEGLGLDLVLYERVPLDDYLGQIGNIVFVSPDGNAICITKDYIENTYTDKNSTWFYECDGPVIKGTNDRSMQSYVATAPYIKMCISDTGMNGYIRAGQVASLLKSKHNLFFIKPHIPDGQNTQLMITHSVDHALATHHPSGTMINTNHCQYGSNILIFDIFSYNASSSSVNNSDMSSTT